MFQNYDTECGWQVRAKEKVVNPEVGEKAESDHTWALGWAVHVIKSQTRTISNKMHAQTMIILGMPGQIVALTTYQDTVEGLCELV